MLQNTLYCAFVYNLYDNLYIVELKWHPEG